MSEILNVLLSPSGCCSGSGASLRLQYRDAGYIHSTPEQRDRSWNRIDRRIKTSEALTPSLSAAIEVHIRTYGEPSTLTANRRSSIKDRIRAVYVAYAAVVNVASSIGEE